MADQFVVSARKYRPNCFKELLGQDAISLTLRRAISQKKTAHAYLFCGPRGVGKTSAARIFAKTINCLHPTNDGESCGECESCKAFQEQRSLNIFELDAASNNSTEDIRRLIDEVSVPPQFGHFKIYIIDEVHMLSQSAFNTFLKTLEEPPSYVVFILATTEKHKILPTILSRCQVYDFKPISVVTIQQQLTLVAKTEGISAEPKALELIAQQADGGMRDALSLFDRLAGFGDGSITYEQTIESLHILSEVYYLKLSEYIYNNDVSAILIILDEVFNKGFDPKTILLGLQNFFRKLMLVADSTTLPLAQVLPQDEVIISKIALDLGRSFLYQALLQLSEAEKKYRSSSAKRLLVEMTIIGFTAIAREKVQQATILNNPNTIRVPSSSTNSISMTSKEEMPISSVTSRTSLANTQPRRVHTSTIVQRKSKNGLAEFQKNEKDTLSSKQYSLESLVEKKTALELTEETLQKAWISFADQNIPSTQKIENVLFRGRMPFLLSSSMVAVKVATTSQKELFEKLRPKLESFLKNVFSLDSLSVDIKLTEEKINGSMQTKSEWYQSQLEQNPSLQKIHNTLLLREI